MPASKLTAGARLFDIARNRMLTGIWSRHPDWPAFSPSFAVKPSDQKFSGRPAAYELFDLVVDPQEQHNLLFDEAEAQSPQVAAVFTELKAELARLQAEYGDDDRYVDPATWPPGTVNGPFPGRKALGQKTDAKALTFSGQRLPRNAPPR